MNQPGLINHARQAFPRVRERRSGTPARRLSGKAGREDESSEICRFDFKAFVYLQEVGFWGSKAISWPRSRSQDQGHIPIIPSPKKYPEILPGSLVAVTRMVPGPSKRCPSVGWATPPRASWRKWRSVPGPLGISMGDKKHGKHIQKHMERLG